MTLSRSTYGCTYYISSTREIQLNLTLIYFASLRWKFQPLGPPRNEKPVSERRRNVVIHMRNALRLRLFLKYQVHVNISFPALYNLFCTNMGPTLPSLFKSSNPLLATLVPTISLAYGLQGLAAVPSILIQSERYYDLSGSLTYLSCTALSLYLPVLRAKGNANAAGGKIVSPLWQSLGTTLTHGRNWRQIALSAAVGIWATRCVYISRPAQIARFD